jgi:hypothetical protein
MAHANLSSECQPFAEKLYLHSGALNIGEEPVTNAQPPSRKRDKASQQVKLEA